MRPAAVAWFERLYIASLTISLALVAYAIGTQWAVFRSGIVPPAVLLIPLGFLFVLPLILVLLVSRRRSNIAKWLLVAHFAFGIASNLWSYNEVVGFELTFAVGAVTAMQAVALFQLFTAPARAWLAAKEGAELKRTFE